MSKKSREIRLVLLTGFLGTGKTTLISKLLNAYKNEKIGVIVNEFGEIGIDGVLIEKEDIKMQELSNGSIFCACIKDNFINSLITMSGEDISILFIEASGLADPANMEQILSGIDSKTSRNYDYKGSICVTDAETFMDYYDLLPALHQQIVYSGIVIVNKMDLVDEEQLAIVLEKITSINSQASIFVTSYCDVDLKQIINDLKIPELPSAESTNTLESRPKTIILKSYESVCLDDLENFMVELSGSVYRIKGFAKTTEGNVYISGVCDHVEITPWDNTLEETKIVIISSVGIRIISLIADKLNGNLKDKLRIC